MQGWVNVCNRVTEKRNGGLFLSKATNLTFFAVNGRGVRENENL